MKQNTLTKLFKELEIKKISFYIRGRYNHLPEKLDGGDVDLVIKAKDFHKLKKILERESFVFYPFTQPNIFYYFHDENLGLIQLDLLLVEKIPPIKKFKSFYIPRNEKFHGNQKKFLKKVQTSLMRRIYFIGKGKVICFDGPDGSGKTTLSVGTYQALKKFKIKKDFIHFGVSIRGEPKIERIFRLSYKILRTYRNKLFGRITIADRYVYFTFRNSSPLLKKILRKVSPKPDITFIVKARPEVIRKRKIGQKDRLQKKTIEELYSVLEEAENKEILNSEISPKKNLNHIINKILKLYRKH